MSVVLPTKQRTAGPNVSVLFFVFPAFVLFPFCALLTCRQVASCRGVNEAQLCVTELIQSEGAFLFPSWTSSLRLPPPLLRRRSLTGKLNKSKLLPRHNACIVTVVQFWPRANLCTFHCFYCLLGSPSATAWRRLLFLASENQP